MTEFTGRNVNTRMSILFCQSFKHALLNPHRSVSKPCKLKYRIRHLWLFIAIYNVFNLCYLWDIFVTEFKLYFLKHSFYLLQKINLSDKKHYLAYCCRNALEVADRKNMLLKC